MENLSTLGLNNEDANILKNCIDRTNMFYGAIKLVYVVTFPFVFVATGLNLIPQFFGYLIGLPAIIAVLHQVIKLFMGNTLCMAIVGELEYKYTFNYAFISVITAILFIFTHKYMASGIVNPSELMVLYMTLILIAVHLLGNYQAMVARAERSQVPVSNPPI